MTTRREFLVSAAGLTVASGIAPSALEAKQPAHADSPPAEIIDSHAHWTGPTVIKLLGQRGKAPRYVTNDKGEFIFIGRDSQTAANERPQSPAWFDLNERIRQLDKAGVQRQVLSWTGATYESALTPEEAKPIWRVQNDDIAKAVRDYPKRFIGLATLPTSQPKEAADELNRAHHELGLAGGTLPLDAFIQLNSARALLPIFEAAQKNRSHIFIHRGPASTPDATTEVGITNHYFGLTASNEPNGRPVAVAGDNVTARSALIASTHLAAGVITLALSDLLDSYPDVTVQIAMIGGSTAFIAEQIQYYEETAHQPDTTARLRRLYYDTGQFGRGPRNIAFAAKVFGADRILFGSDYGAQASIVPYVQGVKDSDLSAADLSLVLSGNAKRIFAQHLT